MPDHFLMLAITILPCDKFVTFVTNNFLYVFGIVKISDNILILLENWLVDLMHVNN